MSTIRPGYVRPLDLKHGRIELSHGSGGRAMAQLIEDLFARHFDNDFLRQGNDGALLPLPPAGGRLVMATDAHVVSPLFFPGGDIGCLSVHGTINDVAVMGARPLWLSASFVLEEGFPLADLERIVASMARASREAGVPVVTGDTKVVEAGKADGVFISTTGVGVVAEGLILSGDRARPGDVVLLSGSIGEHGMAIMAVRESLGFAAPIVSDTAALHELIAAMLAGGAESTEPPRPLRSLPPQGADAGLGRPGAGIRCLRDPTRGGLATTLNEIARQSGVGMLLDESAIPVNGEVAAACEFLGLDPLYVANEGKLVAVVAADDAERVLAAMRAHPLGARAARIGEVVADEHHFVQMTTALGGRRIVDWLTGDQLPRIC
jgi:hydrogenase expression/formation protein HypE